jgi:hypothetical protein
MSTGTLKESSFSEIIIFSSRRHFYSSLTELSRELEEGEK